MPAAAGAFVDAHGLYFAVGAAPAVPERFLGLVFGDVGALVRVRAVLADFSVFALDLAGTGVLALPAGAAGRAVVLTHHGAAHQLFVCRTTRAPLIGGFGCAGHGNVGAFLIVEYSSGITDGAQITLHLVVDGVSVSTSEDEHRGAVAVQLEMRVRLCRDGVRRGVLGAVVSDVDVVDSIDDDVVVAVACDDQQLHCGAGAVLELDGEIHRQRGVCAVAFDGVVEISQHRVEVDAGGDALAGAAAVDGGEYDDGSFLCGM